MAKKVKKSKKQTPFGRLFSFMRPYRGGLIVGTILIFIAVLVYAAAPLFMADLLDGLGKIFEALKNNQDFTTVMIDSKFGTFNANEFFVLCLVLMISCYALYSIFSYIANRLMVSATNKTVYALRKEIDKKLAKLPLNYYDTNTKGDILSRITNDVDTVSNALQTSVYQVINAVFTVVIVLIMMLSISGWLTLVGLLSVPIVIYIASKITKKSQKMFDEQTHLTGELNGYVEEYYSGHNVVAVCGKEEQVIDDFTDINDNLKNASERGQALSAMLTPITQSMTNFGYVLVALVGVLIAMSGGLSIGLIQAFTQYLVQFTTPITTVMQLYSIIQTTESASKRIFEFLDEEEEVPNVENPQFPDPLKGSVQFEHVKFGYQPHKNLIKDFNLDIKAGTKNAIVGPTGCGKTTLVNLIMRFYDVKGGAIKVDGVNIRDMRREDLRNIFGMVLQDTWLYSGTIKENIRYGKLDATDEEVYNAAKMACCDSFIQTLPGGYDCVIQEGAENIAQGQRQLLTIARAMLNDPPILILDEATSSVDTRTEKMIQEAMNNMMKGKTSFVIAHRLSTITDSDNILYMQDGDVLEVGTHDELMARDGLYAKLYNSQFADEVTNG